jgi:hypothetical protein
MTRNNQKSEKKINPSLNFNRKNFLENFERRNCLSRSQQAPRRHIQLALLLAILTKVKQQKKEKRNSGKFKSHI